MFRNLFSPTKNILCPYCLAEINFREGDKVTHCPKTIGKDGCGIELPTKYVSRFDQMAPCFAQLVGWSQVGKTVYLQALTATLMKMGVIWRNNFAPAALTNATLRYTRNVKSFMASGTMPPRTQLQLQEAYIMQLENMTRWGSRTLVMRDVAGEHFNDLKFNIEQTPYLLHVPTTLMMLSISDLEKQNFTMDELMNSLIQTLMNNDPNYGKTKRNVVIVLSKADLIARDLPQQIQEYLLNDPIAKILGSTNDAHEMGEEQMEDYMKNLKKISDAIQAWLKGTDSGSVLVALANNESIDLRFSIVSSTGGQVGGNNQMNVAITPTRVLDPFLWALEFQSKPAKAN